jgi:hypothetical protein
MIGRTSLKYVLVLVCFFFFFVSPIRRWLGTIVLVSFILSGFLCVYKYLLKSHVGLNDALMDGFDYADRLSITLIVRNKFLWTGPLIAWYIFITLNVVNFVYILLERINDLMCLIFQYIQICNWFSVLKLIICNNILMIK